MLFQISDHSHSPYPKFRVYLIQGALAQTEHLFSILLLASQWGPLYRALFPHCFALLYFVGPSLAEGPKDKK